jgi:hypothetical protein
MSQFFPGAVILVNDSVSPIMQQQLMLQLQISEFIDGYTFDQRVLQDPNYPFNVRALNLRVMVSRNFQDLTNRGLFDVAIFVKNALASIEKNNFGPIGQTFPVKNLYWGQLGIFFSSNFKPQIVPPSPYYGNCGNNGDNDFDEDCHRNRDPSFFVKANQPVPPGSLDGYYFPFLEDHPNHHQDPNFFSSKALKYDNERPDLENFGEGIED